MRTACNYANKAPQLEEMCSKAVREGDTDTLKYIYDEALHCYNHTQGTISDRFAAIYLEAEQYLEDTEYDFDKDMEE